MLRHLKENGSYYITRHATTGNEPPIRATEGPAFVTTLLVVPFVSKLKLYVFC